MSVEPTKKKKTQKSFELSRAQRFEVGYATDTGAESTRNFRHVSTDHVIILRWIFLEKRRIVLVYVLYGSQSIERNESARVCVCKCARSRVRILTHFCTPWNGIFILRPKFDIPPLVNPTEGR